MHDMRILLVVALAVLCGGLIHLVARWPMGSRFTFSQHAAQHRRLILYYILLFLIVLIPLNIFFWTWLIPIREVPALFGVLAAISSILQFACTLVPEVGRRKIVWHRVFAGLSAILLLLALPIVAFSPQISFFNEATVWAGVVAMVLVVVAVVAKKGKPEGALWLQAAYFSAFFIPIVAVAL